MKKIIFVLIFAITGSLFGLSDAFSQRYDEAEYDYSDVNSGIIYQLYLKFSGYQVTVWMKNNQQSDWTTCTVTSSDDETISFTTATGYQYHIELDPYNEDAVILYSSDFTSSWKYYLKQ
ncbi:MAG: hypothetical protein JXR68_14365 [Bacteroidales bacterium]|nr:hypothetical protein [Bacteroidales bacterium]